MLGQGGRAVLPLAKAMRCEPALAGFRNLSPGGSSCRRASGSPDHRKSRCCHMLYSPVTHMCLISGVRSLQLVGDC